MAGGRRKPTAVLEASGAFIKNPQRKRRNDLRPPGSPLGDPPERLNEIEQTLWYECASTLCPGTAFASDRQAFSILITLLAREHAGALLPPERSQLLSLMGRFGMSPSDRSKLGAEKSDAPESKLAAFLRKGDEMRAWSAANRPLTPDEMQERNMAELAKYRKVN